MKLAILAGSLVYRLYGYQLRFRIRTRLFNNRLPASARATSPILYAHRSIDVTRNLDGDITHDVNAKHGAPSTVTWTLIWAVTIYELDQRAGAILLSDHLDKVREFFRIFTTKKLYPHSFEGMRRTSFISPFYLCDYAYLREWFHYDYGSYCSKLLIE